MFKSAPLQDIGKVDISDRILLKPERMALDEMEIMVDPDIVKAFEAVDAGFQMIALISADSDTFGKQRQPNMGH